MQRAMLATVQTAQQGPAVTGLRMACLTSLFDEENGMKFIDVELEAKIELSVTKRY